jgi:hypothetical protein
VGLSLGTALWPRCFLRIVPTGNYERDVLLVVRARDTLIQLDFGLLTVEEIAAVRHFYLFSTALPLLLNFQFSVT